MGIARVPTNPKFSSCGLANAVSSVRPVLLWMLLCCFGPVCRCLCSLRKTPVSLARQRQGVLEGSLRSLHHQFPGQHCRLETAAMGTFETLKQHPPSYHGDGPASPRSFHWPCTRSAATSHWGDGVLKQSWTNAAPKCSLVLSNLQNPDFNLNFPSDPSGSEGTKWQKASFSAGILHLHSFMVGEAASATGFPP